MDTANTFVTGSTYVVRGDGIGGQRFTCLGRTAKYVTMRSDTGREARMLVRDALGYEVVLPYGSGRYAPRVAAIDIVRPTAVTVETVPMAATPEQMYAEERAEWDA